MSSKFVGAGLFFLFIFLSGFWLSRTGKPYSTLIFTIHKLIGLALGFFMIVIVYRIHQTASLSPVQVLTIVVTVLLFIVTVAAGGMLSIDKSMPFVVSLSHKVLPFLTVISTGTTLYLLLG
jgi:hypothetical protein